MPFDNMAGQPERPQVDRDKVAIAIQDELGQPLSWNDYVKIWNCLTAKMGLTDWLYAK